MPAAVERVSCSHPAEPQPRGSQTWDWQEKQRRLVWKFKKVPGGSEHTLQVRSQSIGGSDVSSWCCWAVQCHCKWWPLAWTSDSTRCNSAQDMADAC